MGYKILRSHSPEEFFRALAIGLLLSQTPWFARVKSRLQIIGRSPAYSGGDKMDAIFVADIFICIFLNENFWISYKI